MLVFKTYIHVAVSQVCRFCITCFFLWLCSLGNRKKCYFMWCYNKTFCFKSYLSCHFCFPFKSFQRSGSIFLDSTGRLCFPSLRSSLVNIALIATHEGGWSVVGERDSLSKLYSFLFPSLSLSHSHFFARSRSLSVSLSNTQISTLLPAIELYVSHTRNTHSRIHSLSHIHSISLTHSFTYTVSHSLSPSIAHTLSLTLTITLFLSSFCPEV